MNKNEFSARFIMLNGSVFKASWLCVIPQSNAYPIFPGKARTRILNLCNSNCSDVAFLLWEGLQRWSRIESFVDGRMPIFPFRKI